MGSLLAGLLVLTLSAEAGPRSAAAGEAAAESPQSGASPQRGPEGEGAPSPSLVPEERPLAGAELMEHQLRDYFAGELAESYVWAGMGLVGLGASIPLFLTDDRIGKPFSYPVFVLAIVQLALGVGLWARTPGQVERLSTKLKEDPYAYVTAERTRMRAVNRNFEIFRLVELGLVVGGTAIAQYGFVRNRDINIGVGLGLALEALLFVGLDYFAHARGDRYEAALVQFQP